MSKQPQVIEAIDVDSWEQDRIVEAAAEALVKHNHEDGKPYFFRRNGKLTVVRRNDLTGAIVLDSPVNAEMQDRLGNATKWRKHRGKKSVPAFVPGPVVGMVASRLAHDERIPVLRGVTEVPMILDNRKILETPGYDAETGWLYSPKPGLEVPKIPKEPTKEEIEAAVATIDDVIGEFPFVDDASRASFYALLISLAGRPLISGPVPMLVVEAPVEGTGKGLILEVASEIIFGMPVEPLAVVGSRDEWWKLMLTLGQDDTRFAVFDNVQGLLSSPTLAAGITSRNFTGRGLGGLRKVSYPNRVCWAMTSNNARLSGDFRRRVYLCRMDARVEEPAARFGPKPNREWRHPELLEHVREHRGKLMAAVLTLIRAWDSEGRPGPAKGLRMTGSFEAWRRVVGGVLRVAGIDDFLGNVAQINEAADAGFDDWRRFFVAWHDRFKSEWVTVPAHIIPELHEYLPSDVDLEGPSLTKQVGSHLRQKKGAVHAGFRLVSEENPTSNHARRWRLERDEVTTPIAIDEITFENVTSGQTAQVDKLPI